MSQLPRPLLLGASAEPPSSAGATGPGAPRPGSGASGSGSIGYLRLTPTVARPTARSHAPYVDRHAARHRSAMEHLLLSTLPGAAVDDHQMPSYAVHRSMYSAVCSRPSALVRFGLPCSTLHSITIRSTRATSPRAPRRPWVATGRPTRRPPPSRRPAATRSTGRCGPPQPVLPLDAPAAVHDPLQERLQQQLRSRLLIQETLGPVLAMRPEEGLELRQQPPHVQPAIRVHVPRRLCSNSWVIQVSSRGTTSA